MASFICQYLNYQIGIAFQRTFNSNIKFAIETPILKILTKD